MDTLTRAGAQERADEIAAFHRETGRLAASRIFSLSPEQKASIDEYHRALLAEFEEGFGVDRDIMTKQLSLGMKLASLFGSLALAASLFFFFLHFWGSFSSAIQLTVLIGASLGTVVVAWIVHHRDRTGYFTQLAALTAFAAFVLNVVIPGSIFNMNPSDFAFLFCAVFAMWLAYAFNLRLLLAAGLVCAAGFLSARVCVWGGGYWLSFGGRPESMLPAAIIIFCVPFVLRHDRFHGFEAVYRVFGMLIFFLPVLVLSNWGAASYLLYDNSWVEAFYQLLGFAGTAVMIWLGIRMNWMEVVRTGTVLFAIFLFTRFFDWWWEHLPKYIFFLFIGLSAVLFLIVIRRVREQLLAASREGRI